MKRRLLPVIASICLLLSLAATALWWRSQSTNDLICWNSNKLFVQILATPGTVQISRLPFPMPYSKPNGFSHYSLPHQAEVERIDKLRCAGEGWWAESDRQMKDFPDARPLLAFIVAFGQGKVTHRHWHGFAIERTELRDGMTVRSCTIPLPSIVFLTVLSPATWLSLYFSRRFLWRRRIRNSRCRNCGYDLRATPNQTPECGENVPHQS